MNIKQLIENNKFNDKYILKLILQDVFDFTKEQLYLNWDKEITIEQFNKIEDIYKKYEQDNIPIEYLLWWTIFMWEKFIVNENTLIPRPETEYLIKYALEEIRKDSIVFDIWTWSGIIWINISKNISNLVICSDVSKEALEVAKKNNQRLNKNSKNIKFMISNLWDHIKTYKWNLIICANLPYVEENFQLDEYAKKEPKTALFAGQDGLDLYRELLDQVVKIKNKKIVLFFELMTKQAEALISEYKDFNFEILDTFHYNIKILKNYNLKSPKKIIILGDK